MARLDDILKKQADRQIADYVRWLMGESVTVIEKLGTEFPGGKRGDVVYLLSDADGNRFVFHLEFQQDRSRKSIVHRGA